MFASWDPPQYPHSHGGWRVWRRRTTKAHTRRHRAWYTVVVVPTSPSRRTFFNNFLNKRPTLPRVGARSWPDPSSAGNTDRPSSQIWVSRETRGHRVDTGERMISFDDPKRNTVGINFKNRSNIFIESNSRLRYCIARIDRWINGLFEYIYRRGYIIHLNPLWHSSPSLNSRIEKRSRDNWDECAYIGILYVHVQRASSSPWPTDVVVQSHSLHWWISWYDDAWWYDYP